MDAIVSDKPLIKAGWLRALLYLLALGIAAAGLLAGFIFALLKDKPDEAGFQALMKGNSPALMVLIFFALSLIITYVFRRWIDRRSFISLGLETGGHLRDALAGASLGLFIVASSCLISELTGHLKWMDILFDPKALFLASGTILLSAFYEELIFRGYLLTNLMESLPKWLALALSAVLFMAFHWNGSGLFPLLNALIMGLIAGIFYIYSRNLWFPVFFHFAWKFMTGPVLDFTHETTSPSLLQATVQGNENITGGTYGLEGSLMITTISLLSAVALYLILQKKINPRFQPVPDRI